MGSCLDSKCAMFTQVCLGPDWNLLHIFHLQCWSLIHLNAVKGTSLSFFYFQVLPFEPDVTTRLKYGGGGGRECERKFFFFFRLFTNYHQDSLLNHPPTAIFRICQNLKKNKCLYFHIHLSSCFFCFCLDQNFSEGTKMEDYLWGHRIKIRCSMPFKKLGHFIYCLSEDQGFT